MGAIDRRDFLVRSGMAISAAVLAAEIPLPKVFADSPPLKLDSWQAVREQFQLSRDCIHLAGFFLTSHPAPVRAAIERHQRGLDADPIGYWVEHEEKQEAAVLRAAANYLAVDPTEIALTDSTAMGLGLLYNGLPCARIRRSSPPCTIIMQPKRPCGFAQNAPGPPYAKSLSMIPSRMYRAKSYSTI